MNQSGYTTGRRNVLLIQIVGSTLCMIQNGNGDGNFVLLGESRDKRGNRGSMILVRGVGVFQPIIFFEYRGSLSTVTQLLTHGLYLRFQDFDSIPQLLLSTIGLVDFHLMIVQTLLGLVHHK
jgi:hypothetical protein